MISIVDLHPDVAVLPAEYVRLLGYPRGWTLDGRAHDCYVGSHRFAASGLIGYPLRAHRCSPVSRSSRYLTRVSATSPSCE